MRGVPWDADQAATCTVGSAPEAAAGPLTAAWNSPSRKACRPGKRENTARAREKREESVYVEADRSGSQVKVALKSVNSRSFHGPRKRPLPAQLSTLHGGEGADAAALATSGSR